MLPSRVAGNALKRANATIRSKCIGVRHCKVIGGGMMCDRSLRVLSCSPPLSKMRTTVYHTTAAVCTRDESDVDSLTRYPNMQGTGGVLRFGDYLGTVGFAMSGAITAGSEAGMDLLGCCVVGTVTAIGGGSIRDMLLGKRVFWFDEFEYVYLSLGTCVVTFLTWRFLQERFGVEEDDEWMLWWDAEGVGAFCIVGAMNGVRAGVPFLGSMMCGMITATFGGMTRDVLCGRSPRILHSHVDMYATTALSGAAVYLALRCLRVATPWRTLAGFATALVMRKLAWTYDWRLPVLSKAVPQE